MTKNKYDNLAILMLALLFFMLWFCIVKHKSKYASSETNTDNYVTWRYNHHELNHQNVYNELISQGIDYPEIVLAQAILETGNYKSYSCTTRHNLFGLRRRDGTYMEFGHWTESVGAYKKYIQKYQELPEDYYKFLDDLGYAEDSIYVVRVKQIVKTTLKDFLNN